MSEEVCSNSQNINYYHRIPCNENVKFNLKYLYRTVLKRYLVP